jgi:hypothetical protein
MLRFVGGFGIHREVNLRGLVVAAGGVHQGELGADLDADCVLEKMVGEGVCTEYV